MSKETAQKLIDKIKQYKWYHKIELPNGLITPGWSPIDACKYAIPDDLTGKRILDIGTWDGYWTWEALKRGAAEVVAIDDFSDTCGDSELFKRSGWETFDLCREAFGFVNQNTECRIQNTELKIQENGWSNNKNQHVINIGMSVYEIEALGEFDIIFCFGTIYHLKHPLLALEKISQICKEELYIETAALDDYSPYRGGIGKGYPKNDMVMEFYPTDQYAKNPGNWWVPTLQCLGAMVYSAGFKSIEVWALTDNPKELSECRGFVYGTKKDKKEPNVLKQAEIIDEVKPLKVAAVMSVPRLGFQDNSFCVFEGLAPLGIPLQKTYGAFWGQCLERAIQTQIDIHNPDAILTIDYDTLFTAEDVKELIRLMRENPEVDALVPVQMGRGDMQALMTVKTKTGQVRDIIQREEFHNDLLKMATGHFGLTLIRTSALMKLPHPWFKGEPNQEGQWASGRIDDDIWFWKQMEKHGLKVYSANRVVIGHLELVAKWPDMNLEKLYQPVNTYQKTGKPEKVWK